MLKLTMLVIVEAMVGIAAAAVLLAVGVPLAIRRGWMVPGDAAGYFIIAAVLAGALVGALFRPGSAINRHGKRGR